MKTDTFLEKLILVKLIKFIKNSSKSNKTDTIFRTDTLNWYILKKTDNNETDKFCFFSKKTDNDRFLEISLS